MNTMFGAANNLKTRGISLRLQWIPGHCSNPGNDMADHLAKEAVGSRKLTGRKGSIETKSLPNGRVTGEVQLEANISVRLTLNYLNIGLGNPMTLYHETGPTYYTIVVGYTC